MALLSPGVQVSVIDQSNYTPAAASSVPFILLATAQNKISGAGTGIAPGTLAANAGKLYLMTSQRDLLATFGVPFFYNTTAGTPINGYELNEYGLLAGYSALGVTSIAYVMRADIDLAALTATLNRPFGAPANGTYWLDTTNSRWGINEWNISNSAFTKKTPSVITDTTYLETSSTVPLASYGSIGDYAVTATNVYNPTYYKRGGPTTVNALNQAPGWLQDGASAQDLYNTWVLIGSDEWKTSWPTVQGTLAPTSITPTSVITINGTNITVGGAPNNTVQSLAGQINSALNTDGVYAANIGGKLTLYADSMASGDHVTVTNAVGNLSTNTATLTFATQPTAPYAVGDSITVTGINPAITLTGATGNGSVATLTFATKSVAPYAVGEQITVAGVNPAITVTGATGNGSVATLTFATKSVAPYTVGESINVAGITGNASVYNGTFVVTACSNTSVSYSSTDNVAYTSGGTIASQTTYNGTYTVTSATTTTVSYASSARSPYVTGGTTVSLINYNGTFTVTASTTTTVSYVSSARSPYVTGGTIVDSSANGGVIYIQNYVGTALATLGITAGEYYAPQYDFGPNYAAPRWRTGQAQPAPTGSVFQQTNSVNQGMLTTVKRYNNALGTYVLQSCPVYTTDAAALYGLDPANGGQAIPAGTTYAQIDPLNSGTSGLLILERIAAGATVIAGTVSNPTFVTGSTFTLSASEPETATVTTPVVVTIDGTTVADFIAAVSAAGVDNVSASVNSAGSIVFTHSTGGDIYLVEGTHTPLVDAGFTTTVTGIRSTYVNGSAIGITLSNWVGSPTFTYIAAGSPPEINPADGTLWYYSDATTADIMIQNNGAWVGYQNVTNDVRGYDLSTTNAAGPIFSTTAPTTQTDTAESPLVYGDLWVDTSDLENYPVFSRWENVSGQDQWVQIDTADQTTINGVLFADARWAPNGTTNPITDPIPPIATGSTPLITSDYLDLDAPNPLLYPEGILLWNTRRSGFNVKSFQVNYFNAIDYPYPDVLPGEPDAWVTASGNRADGAANMGRHAQRALIVKALREAIDTNAQLREQQAQFNLIVCTQYPELAPNMRVLNNDRGDTAFSLVDTPLRLDPADVVAWATNNNGLGLTFGDGNLAQGDSYSAAFYPSCTATDLTGNVVVTAPSHMMLRTIIRSDSVSYPWFAPAGLRRGVVDNALQIGYLQAKTGEFQPLGVGQGLRDVLYQNDVNPITFIPGTGITNFGNHTLQGAATALDRINVARLVAYLRGRLEIIGNQYLFEPNDTITRSAIQAQITSLMVNLVNKRALYDYLVVCDTTNNTPATIDANELYVDIAIEPVKAVEFIYIPMRIQNTGEIATQGLA